MASRSKERLGKLCTASRSESIGSRAAFWPDMETTRWKRGYKAKPVQYRTARRQREDAYPLTYNASSEAELLGINFTPERIIRPNVNHMHVRTKIQQLAASHLRERMFEPSAVPTGRCHTTHIVPQSSGCRCCCFLSHPHVLRCSLLLLLMATAADLTRTPATTHLNTADSHVRY